MSHFFEAAADAAKSTELAIRESMLERDEIILWQCRPDTAVRFSWRDKSEVFGGVMTIVLGTFIVLVSISTNSEVIAPLWFLIPMYLIPGLVLTLRRTVFAALDRRVTSYALTSRRAAILVNRRYFGGGLKFYRVTPQMVIEFNEGTPFSDIYFGEKERYIKINGIRLNRPIGFERITDGRRIVDLIREIQINTR